MELAATMTNYARVNSVRVMRKRLGGVGVLHRAHVSIKTPVTDTVQDEIRIPLWRQYRVVRESSAATAA